MTAGQLPEGRYGPRDSGQRRRGAALVGLLLTVLAGLVVAVIAYRNLGSTPVRGETLGFILLDSNPDPETYGVELRLNVIRDDPSRPAVCIVRARSLDGEETGRREIYVPPLLAPLSSPLWCALPGPRSPPTFTDARLRCPPTSCPDLATDPKGPC